MGKTGLHRKVFQSHKMMYLSKYKSHRTALLNSMKESNLAPISNDHQRWSGSSVDGCKIIETAIIWIRSRAQWAGWWSYDELAGSAMVPLAQMQRIFYGICPFLWDSDNLWIKSGWIQSEGSCNSIHLRLTLACFCMQRRLFATTSHEIRCGWPILTNRKSKRGILTVLYTSNTTTIFNAATKKLKQNAGWTSLQKIILKHEWIAPPCLSLWDYGLMLCNATCFFLSIVQCPYVTGW